MIPKALREMGYVPARDLVLEERYADGRLDRLPDLARELVRLRMDVIVAIASASVRAAMAATSTIPIVIYGNFDPVAAGLVKSLAKPEGNVTGVLIAPAGTLAAKKLELLKEAVPGATRVAFLAPADPGIRPQVQETQQAAASLGIKLAVTRGPGRRLRAGVRRAGRRAAGGPLRRRVPPSSSATGSGSSSSPRSTACPRSTSGPSRSRTAA